MKRFILMLSVLVVSCSNNPKTIEETVQDYVKSHVNDPSSYRPQQTKVDSFFATAPNSLSIKALNDSIKHYDDDLFTETMMNDKIKARRNELWDTMVARSGRFQPVFWGWKVTHSFRSKNAFGALVLQTDTFYLDKNKNVVPRDSILVD